MPNFVRIILGALILTGGILLIIYGHIALGIIAILLALLVLVSYIFNENMLLAQWFLRKEKVDRTQYFLNRITNPERQLISIQRGYHQLLQGLIVSRTQPMQSEKYFKRALSLGLHMDHNVALAKLSLAGISMAKRNKREALAYLADAKKADKNKLLAEQIKQMKDQIGLLDKQQVRYR